MTHNPLFWLAGSITPPPPPPPAITARAAFPATDDNTHTGAITTPRVRAPKPSTRHTGSSFIRLIWITALLATAGFASPAFAQVADLVIPNLTVSDTTPTVGVPFTVNAIVKNKNATRSQQTTLRYRLSRNRAIGRSGGTQVATDSVGRLNLNQRSQESAMVTINSTGTWYIGACVDTYTLESPDTNNCFAFGNGVQVTVTAAAVAPQITTQPTDQSVTVGENATFTVTATGTPTPTYQWRFEGSDIAGATSASYAISSAALTNAGDYTVVVTNTAGTVTSTAATLTVTASPTTVAPQITTQPTNQSVTVGGSATFTVVATGTPTPTYQWRFEGSDIAGATLATYTLSNAALTDGGSYTVVVTNSVSSVTSTAATLTVTAAPLLTVESVSVSSASVVAGASFTINATVHNRGGGASAAATLTWYRSDNSTISTSDTSIGTDAVDALAASGSSPENISVSIANAGVHYVGACVATDNCSEPGVQVTVTAAPSAAPDLTVGSVGASVSRVGISVPFMLSATVQNAGTLATAATTLRYYRSNDATITTDDTQLATAAVAALAPDASSSQSAEVSIPDSRRQPPTTTTWWVGACVDAVNNEDATNNCSSGTAVEVVSEPDLIVKDARVSDATVETGTSFTVTATVENIGKRASNHSSLHIYRSDDNTVTEDAIELAVVRNVLSLPPSYAANNSETYTATVSISVAGAFQIIACVIPAPSVGKTDDMSNNCSNPVPVTVALPPPIPPPPPPPTPDLTVENVSVTDATLEHGASLTINATVRNRGSGASPATTLRYYISDDATITADDPQYAPRMNVGALAPGASSPQSVEITILYPEGSYWLGACVGAVNEESATANNCSRGVQISVVVPDLTVTSVSVADASVAAGASFIINATVQNTGGATAAATTLRYFLSGAVTIDTTDTELATTAVPALAPAASSQQSATVSIPDAGNYWVSACVDPVRNETLTSDNASNCGVGVPVTVIVPSDDTDADTNAALPAILQLLLEP